MATSPNTPPNPYGGPKRSRTASSVAHSVASATQGATRTAGDILSQDAPLSFWSAAGVTVSRAPTVREIRRGSFGPDGWQRSDEQTQPRRPLPTDTNGTAEPLAPFVEEVAQRADSTIQSNRHLTNKKSGNEEHEIEWPVSSEPDTQRVEPTAEDNTPAVVPWTTASAIGFKAFIKWTITPVGFFVVLYGLNVVAWGGMLFLLLCNASPAMCWAPVPSPEAEIRRPPAAALKWVSTQPRVFNCNSLNSPRRIWIEIDSQILNALFCVTGFGLVPWRFRDLFYLLLYRFTSQRRVGSEKKMFGLRKLADIHRRWFRLAPSSLPTHRDTDNTTTGVRAPATAVWKMDFFVWCNVWNTLFQVMLCVFMWHFNRYNRPSWATGLFIALACIIAGAGGIMSYLEGKKVKKIEGGGVTSRQSNRSGGNEEQIEIEQC